MAKQDLSQDGAEPRVGGSAIIAAESRDERRQRKNDARLMRQAEANALRQGPPPEFKRRILKEGDGHHVKDRPPEFLTLSDELLAQISRFNGNLTPAEVHHALSQGKTVYTGFSRYRLEA